MIQQTSKASKTPPQARSVDGHQRGQESHARAGCTRVRTMGQKARDATRVRLFTEKVAWTGVSSS